MRYLIVLTLFFSCKSFALSKGQLIEICHDKSVYSSCVKNPQINAYIGGGLDLYMYLNESGLAEPCNVEFYDVGKVLEFMLDDHSDSDDNAMKYLVEYFHGCKG